MNVLIKFTFKTLLLFVFFFIYVIWTNSMSAGGKSNISWLVSYPIKSARDIKT